jgi:Icc-related predicted phosphoesterase
VIVTHHSVDPLAIPRLTRDDLVGAACSSRLLDLVEELHPDCWLTGHIHHSSDRLVGRTRLVSNAKGYGPFNSRPGGIWQNPQFDPRFTFAL